MDRETRRQATLLCLIANCHRDSKQPPFTVQDFIAKPSRAKRNPRSQQAAAGEAFFRNLVARGLAREIPADSE